MMDGPSSSKQTANAKSAQVDPRPKRSKASNAKNVGNARKSKMADVSKIDPEVLRVILQPLVRNFHPTSLMELRTLNKHFKDLVDKDDNARKRIQNAKKEDDESRFKNAWLDIFIEIISTIKICRRFVHLVLYIVIAPGKWIVITLHTIHVNNMSRLRFLSEISLKFALSNPLFNASSTKIKNIIDETFKDNKINSLHYKGIAWKNMSVHRFHETSPEITMMIDLLWKIRNEFMSPDNTPSFVLHIYKNRITQQNRNADYVLTCKSTHEHNVWQSASVYPLHIGTFIIQDQTSWRHYLQSTRPLISYLQHDEPYFALFPMIYNPLRQIVLPMLCSRRIHYESLSSFNFRKGLWTAGEAVQKRIDEADEQIDALAAYARGVLDEEVRLAELVTANS